MSRERRPPKMIGPFAQVAEDFIQYKRSCGFKYENEPKCLSRFCRDRGTAVSKKLLYESTEIMRYSYMACMSVLMKKEIFLTKTRCG